MRTPTPDERAMTSSLSSRILLSLFVGAFACAGFANCAAATIVYPTGSYPLDAQNVQAALDGGGTVLLKATNAAGVPTAFDFGPSDVTGGWVEMFVDAELIGEHTAAADKSIHGRLSVSAAVGE